MTETSKTNGFNKKETAGFTKRIEKCLDQLLSLKGEHMAACKAVREDIADIYKEAKAKGIPTKPFKAYIKQRGLLAQAEDCRDDLDGDDIDSFDLIKQAMGELADTPLGKAALKTIPGGKGGEALDDLTDEATKQ